MAWLYRARESLHKTGRPQTPGKNSRTASAAALAALFAVASCTAPSPQPDQSTTTAPAASVSGSPKAPQTASPQTGTRSPSAAAPATRALGWGPQQRDADAAAAAVAKMTLQEKAGQVILPFYTGLDYEAQAATVERFHLAGSMIMADNVPGTATGLVDVPALAGVTRRMDKASRAGGRTWPGLVGVDQEGGAVSRVGAPLTRWPTPMSYGAAGSVPLAAEAGAGLAAELAPLGFTVDFAPAADVTMGPADPTIGARSMSGDPRAAASLSAGFAKGMLAGGVLPTVKHFPGHGSVTTDSHKGLPVQNATLAQLKARDWKPFQSAIQAGAPMVMTGHIAARALEPGVPASLSKATYSALRGLGFKGVAVTDGLNMGAVAGRYPRGAAAPAALAAGADLLLMPADAAAAHAAVVGAVTGGKLPLQRLEDAARRVVTMMIWRGRTAQPKPPAAPGSGEALSAKISARAITVVAGKCKGAAVAGHVRVAGGTPVDQARFAAAAKDAGISLGTGPLVTLIGYGGAPAKSDIAVSLDAPWPLAQSAAPTRIALYGRSPGAYKALLAVLAGKAAAPGKLPAAVGPYRAGTGCR